MTRPGCGDGYDRCFTYRREGTQGVRDGRWVEQRGQTTGKVFTPACRSGPIVVLPAFFTFFTTVEVLAWLTGGTAVEIATAPGVGIGEVPDTARRRRHLIDRGSSRPRPRPGGDAAVTPAYA